MSTVHFAAITLKFLESGAVSYPHPGSAKGEPDSHPATDHRDRPTIPGSTIAGSLRRHFETKVGQDIDHLFGKADDSEVTRSKIVIQGVVGAETNVTESHRATAIDRHRGAATSSTLRHNKVLARGATFEIYVSWSGLSDTTPDILSSLCTWHPNIGGGTSVGQGQSEVVQLRYGSLNLDNDADLLCYLTNSGPRLFDVVCKHDQEVESRKEQDRVSLRFEITSALHCGGEIETQIQPGGESGQINGFVKRDGVPLIPAQTLKGIVRSRVEFILNSLNIQVCYGSEGRGSCLCCRIFGYGGKESRRALVRFHDAQIENPAEQFRTHVAIDRFTGGALAHALYTDRVISSGEFILTMERLGADEDTWQMAQHLLALVAKDLNDGFIGIGGSQSRGYGEVRLVGDSEIDIIAAQTALSRLVPKSPEEVA